ncbi:PP2C family protein-serine/threonine phosphatase [Luteococcus peritonei]|uniref:PP2C family protein-serine/threonine phosphatase n=1 Tax=Luteococcus peritonei TaxID=88874 RepID=A0ABW4RW68_9ACTN
MAFSLDIRAHSEVGLVRKNNQDSGYASPTMLLVADGMGGAAAGDLASTVAVREVMRADRAHRPQDTDEVLAGSLARANHTLADLVKQDPSLDGMGTTVCGALFTGEELGMVHIGDSRAYLLRDEVLHRLTHDHSWVQSLVDDGKISLAEAAVHPHRSLLLKVLNGQPSHEPDYSHVELQSSDRLLFCSDGLCGFVKDTAIRHIMVTAADLDTAMAELVAAAHAGGGADNITVLLADVVPQDAALDAREGVVVGAAVDGIVPETEEHTLVGLAAQSPAPEPVARQERVMAPGVVDEAETTRYAPTAVRRRTLVKALALTTALVLLAGGALWGGWRWSRTQYFVGDQDDQVAIFRGIPGELLGISLHETAEITDVRVADLPAFFQQQVFSTIPAQDLDGAHSTVEQLRTRAEACIARRANRLPGPRVEPSSLPSASASPSASHPGLPIGPRPTVGASGLVGASASPTPSQAVTTSPSGLDEEC